VYNWKLANPYTRMVRTKPALLLRKHRADRLVPRRARIFEAMQACPRDAFVIPAHRREALVDAPIRVAEHGFNISAPHMHACCLEALQLGPGHKCDHLERLVSDTPLAPSA